jgi:hypothetical protein
MAYQSEAVINITTRMRDDASVKSKGFTETLREQRKEAYGLRMSLMSVGSTLTSVGALMTQLNSPAAQLAGKFLLTAGALASTASAIIGVIPLVKTLITWLKSLAITQSIVQALSGPAGWVTLGAGLAIAAGATAGVHALTSRNAGEGGGAPAVNIYSTAFTGSKSEARKFGRDMQTIAREDTRLGR